MGKKRTSQREDSATYWTTGSVKENWVALRQEAVSVQSKALVCHEFGIKKKKDKIQNI